MISNRTYINYNNAPLLSANDLTAFIYETGRLKEGEAKYSFKEIESKMWMLNLEMIDSKLPLIVACALLFKLEKRTSNWIDVITHLTKSNPINYNAAFAHQIYEAKLKSFITALALGMNQEKAWQGASEAIIGINHKGKNIDYLYSKAGFEDYLLNSTQLTAKIIDQDDKRILLSPQINFI